MKAKVRKINGVRGFMPTTYAVYVGEKIVKICMTKKEADNIAKELEA
jgi:hypothetical protein